MKGYTEATKNEISQVAKKEMEALGYNYNYLVRESGFSLSHVKNAIHYNSNTIKPEVYIQILSYLGIEVLVLYSAGMIQYYYKKLKKAK